MDILVAYPQIFSGVRAMEIASFDVSPDRTVTLHMTDMPQTGVRISNTTVRIGGIPQPEPEEISGQRQEIIFIASPTAEPGRITIMIEKDGHRLHAISAENYTPPKPPEPQKSHPQVNSITPKDLKPGKNAVLRGRGLQTVIAVRLGLSDVIRTVTATESSVLFTVPEGALPGDVTIFLLTSDGDGFVTTKRIVKILNRMSD